MKIQIPRAQHQKLWFGRFEVSLGICIFKSSPNDPDVRPGLESTFMICIYSVTLFQVFIV